ncbi:hypothetical protein BC835DRAFT_1489398, partial [Cytidiella melzeri]
MSRINLPQAQSWRQISSTSTTSRRYKTSGAAGGQREMVQGRRKLEGSCINVYEDALQCLKVGISLEEVKRVNRELFATHGYKEMPRDLATSRYRWLLVGKDNRLLYRQFHRLRGVKIVQKDHINLHEWLDEDSPQFNETLKKAIFHYVPRTKHEGRLEVCIATSEMRAAAWKYGHHSQVLLDGTFGISDKKMLLFIVMGIDEANRGVPLAFLLFSAPASNQKTAAGYNTDILKRLLNAW